MNSRPIRQSCLTLVTLVSIGLSPSRGDDPIVKVQPDRLNFGTLYVGSRAEGSVRIFVDPKDIEAKKAKADPPGFVKIRSVNVDTQEYGKGNVKGFCDIAVSIDTEKAGNYSSKIAVTIGERRVEVPIEAVVRERRPGLSRVLVIATPFQKYSTDDGKLFDTWRKLVDREELDVDYREANPAQAVFDGVDLAKFEVVLLGETGIYGLQDADVASLTDWAKKGGRIVVTANYFYRGTVDQANKLLVPAGLTMRDKEGPPGKNEITLDAASIPPCPFTEGVKTLYFHRPSPTDVTDADRTMVLATSPIEHGGNLIVIAMMGEGQVVAIGESLWWSWITKADNAVLMGHILRRRPKLP